MKEIYRTTGIYRITNTINGKSYIGQTRMNFGDRWDQHKACLRHGYHGNKILQEEWDQFGENSFEFVVIEKVDDFSKLDELEKHYIAKYASTDQCYNMTAGGRVVPPLSEEARKLIGEKNRQRMLGSKLSEETRKKMSDKQFERWKDATPEDRAAWGKKMSECLKGKPNPKVSAIMKNNKRGAKYSVDDVHKIRGMHEILGMRSKDIAEVLGMHPVTVDGIVKYRRWADV